MPRQHTDSLHRRLHIGLLFTSLLSLCAAAPAQSTDGLLGIYFDRDATRCTGSIASGSSTTLYVLLIGEGATSSGLTGAEFRIDTSEARSYLFLGEIGYGVVQLGSAFSDGINIAFQSCQSGRAVSVMSFQVFNPGSGSADAALRVVAHAQPSNPNFPCTLVLLCDSPIFTPACVEGGKAVLNPATERPCGSAREEAEWSRVKELYKP